MAYDQAGALLARTAAVCFLIGFANISGDVIGAAFLVAFGSLALWIVLFLARFASIQDLLVFSAPAVVAALIGWWPLSPLLVFVGLALGVTKQGLRIRHGVPPRHPPLVEQLFHRQGRVPSSIERVFE